jgi:hypothetical protein
MSICTSCGATIAFLRTKKGGAMPIDAPFPPQPVQFDPLIHKSHFVTCPNAAAHRKKKIPKHSAAAGKAE